MSNEMHVEKDGGNLVISPVASKVMSHKSEIRKFFESPERCSEDFMKDRDQVSKVENWVDNNTISQIKLNIWNLISELPQRTLVREDSETMKNYLCSVNFRNWYNKE